MTDFNINDDELNAILGLSDHPGSGGYVPSFTNTSKPLVFLHESLEKKDQDSLSSIADIQVSDDEISNDILFPLPVDQYPSNNVEAHQNLKSVIHEPEQTVGRGEVMQSLNVEQLQRIVSKLEENTTRVNTMEDEYKMEIVKAARQREDIVREREEKLLEAERLVKIQELKNIEKERMVLTLVTRIVGRIKK